MSSTLESTIERYLVEQVERLGGVAEKTVSPGGRGYFDRVVVLPGGRVIFCEVKKPKGGLVSPHQKLRHERYRALDVEVAILRRQSDVDALLT